MRLIAGKKDNAGVQNALFDTSPTLKRSCNLPIPLFSSLGNYNDFEMFVDGFRLRQSIYLRMIDFKYLPPFPRL